MCGTKFRLNWRRWRLKTAYHDPLNGLALRQKCPFGTAADFQRAAVFAVCSNANGFQTACYVTAPLLKPALRRGLTLASATCIGEFAATLFPVAPRMADADYFDLRLSRTRRCGQLRTGDGVDGAIDRFGFDGVFAGGRSGRTKGRLNMICLNSLTFTTLLPRLVSKID